MAKVLLVALLLLWPIKDNGQYEGSPLKPWFNQLHSKKGLCCSDADGALVKDADWETYRGPDGQSHYRVGINGKLIDVPDDAIVTEPNRYGPAMVWGYRAGIYGSADGYVIRCFLPGSMS
jgi:hypothetical protein